MNAFCVYGIFYSLTTSSASLQASLLASVAYTRGALFLNFPSQYLYFLSTFFSFFSFFVFLMKSLMILAKRPLQNEWHLRPIIFYNDMNMLLYFICSGITVRSKELTKLYVNFMLVIGGTKLSNLKIAHYLWLWGHFYKHITVSLFLQAQHSTVRGSDFPLTTYCTLVIDLTVIYKLWWFLMLSMFAILFKCKKSVDSKSKTFKFDHHNCSVKPFNKHTYNSKFVQG